MKKLNELQKAEIIENLSRPKGERRTQVQLAADFGVAQPSICAFIKRWKKKQAAANE